MTAIKDAVDLITQLRVLESQKKNFGLQRQHAEEMDKLKATILALQAKQLPTPDAKFNPEIGTWFDASSRIHYCPRCWGAKNQGV